MFRPLLRHLQGELCRILKTIVTLITELVYRIHEFRNLFTLLKKNIWFTVRLKIIKILV